MIIKVKTSLLDIKCEVSTIIKLNEYVICNSDDLGPIVLIHEKKEISEDELADIQTDIMEFFGKISFKLFKYTAINIGDNDGMLYYDNVLQ